MCIRDRHEVDRAKECYRRLLQADPNDAGAFGLLEAMLLRAEPVSYTHLRAHETVLDLVCRLLLEKTQHTQHNTHTHTQHTLKTSHKYHSISPHQSIINTAHSQ